MKTLARIVLVVIAFCSILANTSCNLFEEHDALECEMVELRNNPASGYYDATVRVELYTLYQAVKSRFTLVTPTNSYQMEALTFIEEGDDPEQLESGDTFVVPLSKPDWKFYIGEQDEIYGSVNFWELIPEKDRWHPLKSEAMEVAQSIEVSEQDGIFKPMPQFLPDEWTLASDEQYGEADCKTLVYQKIRVGEVKEEVNIVYCELTDEEKKELETISETEVLTDWTEWTRKCSQLGLVAGHTAVYWDMEGCGYFGWSYRYAYIDGDTVTEVTVASDPLEWEKTEQEKAEERRTRRVFITYGYGPVGEPGWEITIVIRANGGGSFNKESERGISITKPFALTEVELHEIETVLQENNFLELESHSGPTGGINSFITVRYDGTSHTVEMRNATAESYAAIEQLIRQTILPRVGEQG